MARKKPWTPEQLRHYLKTGEEPGGPPTSRVSADRIEFVVPGIPRPKARPRVTKHGTYTPERTRLFQERVRFEFKCDFGMHFAPWTCPVALGVVAYGAHHAADTDNICKAVADALNGLAYKDDRQITRIHAEKRKADDKGPRTVVVVMKLDTGGRADG